MDPRSLQFCLTPHERRHFLEQGYLVVPDALDRSTTDRLLQAVDRVEARERTPAHGRDRLLSFSNILPEDQAKAKGVPYKLAATTPLVVPVNQVVEVLVTGADVIHAFAVPAFGIITDAVPGKVNHTWFKVDRVGTFYGSCRELCGVDHAFMPIEVHVVSQADFDAWVAKKGGGTKAAPAAAEAATPAAATAPAAPGAAAPTTTPAAPAPAPAAK